MTHLKKRLPAAVVAATLMGVAAPNASADGILFPYLSTQSGVFSFVTIVNDGTSANYHFTYGHKSAPIANTANCNHFDGDVRTTYNDMMTFEVGNKVKNSYGGPALFEETGDANGAAPIQAGALTSLPLPLPVGNQIAFLSVENAPSEQASTVVDLFGWAEVIDTGANLSLAYSTHNFVTANAAFPSPRADYSNIAGLSWPSNAVMLSWYPTSVVSSAWHVLNLGSITNMSPASGSALRRGYTASGTYSSSTNGGAFDRDELFFSGSKTTRIRCFGIIGRSDVLGAGVEASTGNGGWTWLVGANAGNAPVSDTNETEGSYTTPGDYYLVHKIQTAVSSAGVGARQTVAREPSKNPLFQP
jgi:hypothetical protein